LIIFSKINLGFIKTLCFIISLITTTGVLPSEFDENISELALNKYLFIFLFIVVVGSFSGTTNGGFKLDKLSLFLINFKEELNKFLFQHNIKGVSIIKKGSSQIELNTFYSLIIFSSILTLLNIMILNINGMNIKGALVYVIASLSNTGEALLIIANINDKIKSEYYFLLNILMICGKYSFIGYFLFFNKIFKVRKLI
jgi:Trk-type K+ transport system membrane component